MENLTFEDWVSIVFRVVGVLTIFAGVIAYIVHLHFRQTYADKRLDNLEEKLDNLGKKLDNLAITLEARMNRVEDKLDKLFFHLIGIDDHQPKDYRGEQKDKDE